jgi:hypothetical protein
MVRTAVSVEVRFRRPGVPPGDPPADPPADPPLSPLVIVSSGGWREHPSQATTGQHVFWWVTSQSVPGCRLHAVIAGINALLGSKALYHKL